MTDKRANNTSPQPVRLPRRKLPHFIQVMLPLAVVISGLMLGMAMPQLLIGDGLWLAAKSGLIALGAMIVAYSVNRMAIERGAALATIGYWSAFAASIASMVIVGGGLFAATFSGLVLVDVERLRLQDYGRAAIEYVETRSRAAAQAGRIGPVMGAIVADLEQKHDCEIARSCISGRGNGGNGPVARALAQTLGRAQAILPEIERGTAARSDILERINASIGNYQSVLSDDAMDRDQKRRELQSIDARLRQSVSELDEAVPVALLVSYARALENGASIPARPAATRRLSAILRGHGEVLEGVLKSVPRDPGAAPSFPGQTGVGDTLDYLAHFAPIAAITFVVELVFPLTLWLYTYLALKWTAHRLSPPEPARPNDHDDFLSGLLPKHLPSPPTDETSDSNMPRGTYKRPPRRRANGHDRPGNR